MESFKELMKQFLKDIDKQPGWVLLLATTYAVIALYGLPEEISLLGRTIKLSNELAATLVTFVAYKIGDLLDEVVFNKRENGQRKKRFESWITESRRNAQDALGVTDGIYSVSMKLAVSAEKQRSVIWIHFFNETAKFMRGLAIPLLIFGALYLSNGRSLMGAILIVTAILMVPLYVSFKLIHISKLYNLAAMLKDSSSFAVQDLGHIRMFFWDGNLVDSAKAAPIKARAV